MVVPQRLDADVFDRGLTRSVGDPAAVFILLGRQARLQKLCHPDPHVLARSRAETERRLRLPFGRQPPLAEVHAELARNLGVPQARVALHLMAVVDRGPPRQAEAAAA